MSHRQWGERERIERRLLKGLVISYMWLFCGRFVLGKTPVPRELCFLMPRSGFIVGGMTRSRCRDSNRTRMSSEEVSTIFKNRKFTTVLLVRITPIKLWQERK